MAWWRDPHDARDRRTEVRLWLLTGFALAVAALGMMWVSTNRTWVLVVGGAAWVLACACVLKSAHLLAIWLRGRNEVRERQPPELPEG